MALKILVGCKRVIDYAVKIRYGNHSKVYGIDLRGLENDTNRIVMALGNF
jgi:hypothetical protein